MEGLGVLQILLAAGTGVRLTQEQEGQGRQLPRSHQLLLTVSRPSRS